jgi:FlaA1/EpsC-like NDP-sugar epimerase
MDQWRGQSRIGIAGRFSLEAETMPDHLRTTIRARLRDVVEMPRSAKRIVALTLDAAMCLFSVSFALYLRLGEWTLITGNQWVAVVAGLGALPLFWVFGLYRAIFRYLGFEALVGVARACAVYGLAFAAIFTFLGVSGVPRTVGLIQPILLFIFVASSRAFARSLLGGLLPASTDSRILIFGAGSSGRQLAAAITGSGEMQVIGFVDDDPTLHGSVLNGRRIFAPNALANVVERQRVTDILLAMPSASRKRRGEIVEALRPLSVKVRTIPGLMDLASGKVEVSALRALDIEDLLGRDVAAPNEILFAKNILGKTVAVTGAGGSIGSELCRQIIAARPDTLLLVEISEFALYAIDSELHRTMPADCRTRIVPLLASVRDELRLREIMTAWKPHTVYHAAAYKHVPLVEHNPVEGVLKNVFGTLNTVRAAIDAGVSDFVLISTDKAVRPTNVMGTTKRLAELCLQALAADGERARLSMVRFGNVLGSSGSVVPLFRRQIAAGGPVTITHEDVTRYFMTIPEAAQLVIQAGAMATGGDVFVLDMGEPVRITDLAHKMIELSGLTVRNASTGEGDIEVLTVGLRPGEKLYEELLIGDNSGPTAHPLIRRAVETHIPWARFEECIERLRRAIDAGDAALLRKALRHAVPEFAPSSDLVDWVHLESAS